MRYLLLYLSVFLCLIAVFGGCGRSASDQPVNEDIDQPIFRNVLEKASFVGDITCFDCHEDEYQGYQEHGMANSMFRLTSENAEETFGSEVVVDSTTGLRYKTVAADSGFYLTEYLIDAKGRETHRLSRRMDWVVGSGTSARTYLSEKDGWFYELPITWYTQKGRWDFSPGYRGANKRFDRKIVDRCVSCHNSYPESVDQTNGKYVDMPAGIGCERCHGPGSIHVAERLASPLSAGEIDLSIVNPAHLRLDARLDVCQQCHLNTSVSLLREGRTPFDFRPSQKLDDYIALYAAHESNNDGIGVISHADRMKLSACFLESQTFDEPLQCTTCHDPHQGFRTKGPEYFNTTCTTCHASETLLDRFKTSENKKIHDPTANCIACHMPKTDLIEAPHSAFTDHWIRVVKDSKDAPQAVHQQSILTAVFEKDKAGSATSDLFMGMALVTEGQRTGKREVLEEAIELLGTALQKNQSVSEAYYLHGFAYILLGRFADAIPSLEVAARMDPSKAERLNALAQAYEGIRQNPDKVEQLYREALRIQPALTDIRINLGRFLESRNRLDEAIDEYKKAVSIEKWNDIGFFNLGTAFLRKGEFKLAESNLKRAIELNPFHGSALSNLGLVYIQQNEVVQAEATLLLAVSRIPFHTESLDNLGTLYLSRDNYPASVSMFKRAVTSNPENDGLLAKLALAQFRNDEFAAAKQTAERALKINPRNELAAQIVAAVE